jgi:plexin A
MMMLQIGLLLSILVVMATAKVTFITKEFLNPQLNESFRHMTKDESTGFIYVAGVNKILKLTEKLTVNQSVRTGPEDDDPDCLPYDIQMCVKKKKLHSYSKALLIDQKDKRLIACSSLFQGSCKKYWHQLPV